MKISLYPDLALLLLRTGMGAMLITHGWPKLQKVMAGDWRFADPLGIGQAPSLLLAMGAEFFCSLLVILGVRARLAALPIIVTMLTAFFIVHASDPFGRKELAMMYAVGFSTIAIAGGGRYALLKD